MTGKSVDVGSVQGHHVFFQCSVGGETPTTVLTDVLSSFTLSNNLLVQRVLLLIWVGVLQVPAVFEFVLVFVESLLAKWTFLLLTIFRQGQTDTMFPTGVFHQTPLGVEDEGALRT